MNTILSAVFANEVAIVCKSDFSPRSIDDRFCFAARRMSDAGEENVYPLLSALSYALTMFDESFARNVSTVSLPLKGVNKTFDGIIACLYARIPPEMARSQSSSLLTTPSDSPSIYDFISAMRSEEH